MYLFILGRQPEIGLAELSAVYGNTKLILPQIAIVKCDTAPDVNRLGGVRKVGRIIWDQPGDLKAFLIDRLSTLHPGKITLGISQYGHNVSAASARNVAISIKKNLDRSVRILPNTTAEIADAATLGNRLGTSPNKIELLIVKVDRSLIVAELTEVQDINAYTFRDRSRPRRDARVGMLPPKLAQTMINLATNGANSGIVLDPFCGTGVVLQEAALMGFNVYGTDIEPRMIDFSRQNLNWLERTQQVKFVQQLETADATSHKWHAPIDFVVCETYLGTPYANPPTPEKLRENMNTCNIIVEKFLRNLLPQLRPGVQLCVAIPAWFVGGKVHHLPIARHITDLGYQVTRTPNLIYHRADQVVGRELLLFRR